MENTISLMNLATKKIGGHSILYWVVLGLLSICTAIGTAHLVVKATGFFLLKKSASPVNTSVVPAPSQVLKEVYNTANSHFIGYNTAQVEGVQKYFSKHLMKVFKQNEGLLTYTLARETRNGTLKRIDVLSEQFQGTDSAIVQCRSTFVNDSSKVFNQTFVKEDNEWKLGLKYGYDIK